MATYFTTAIAVAAGMAATFGVLYLFVAIRRPSRRVRGLLFAGFAFSYAVASLTARASFLSDSVEAQLRSGRVSFIFAALGFGFLGWYVHWYTSVGSRTFLWGLTIVWALVVGMLIAAPDPFFGSEPQTNVLVLTWGEEIRVLAGDPSPALLVATLAQLVLIGYITFAAVRQYRRGDRTEGAVLGVGVGWFAVALVAENLSTLGILELPPTADFGFLGFLVALSFARVNETLEYERELERERAELERRVSERTAELESAQGALVERAEEEAAAAERSRISRDLHDAVSQLLFSINLLAGSLPRLWRSDPDAAERSTAELQRLARGALAEMRTLLRELRPHTIPNTDLELLVTQLTEGVSARIDVPIAVDFAGEGSPPPEVHVATYRICQEALTNAARHADASRIGVTVRSERRSVRLAVTDDGDGIDPSARPAGTMGLATMAERARDVGGSLSVEPGAQRGTVVTFAWGEPDA